MLLLDDFVFGKGSLKIVLLVAVLMRKLHWAGSTGSSNARLTTSCGTLYDMHRFYLDKEIKI